MVSKRFWNIIYSYSSRDFLLNKWNSYSWSNFNFNASHIKNKKYTYMFRLLSGSAAGLLVWMLSKDKIYIQEIHSKFAKLAKDFKFLPVLEASNKSLKLRIGEDTALKGLKLNHRERRFMKFASVEYEGQLYMTPQDFIESVTDSEPRPRLKRRVLQKRDIEKFHHETPPLGKSSSTMFRSIYDKEPQTGFRIAFNMFDTDGNKRVDKDEFLVLENIFSTARKDRIHKALESTGKFTSEEDEVEIEDELQKSHTADTTLLMHFFGRKGKQELKYEDFRMFMENLQTEILEIEFNEFSKGLPTISELDFANILLRYTYLQSDQYEMYLSRLLDRMPEEQGITFPEFKAFCQFLNTLDDFAIAMKMYTLADQPISQDEFHRAVKICTKTELSRHIVDTVFQIFDEDGDGQLSYKEFIAIMKDRLHRGFKEVSSYHGLDAFKACVKSKMLDQR